MNPIDLSSFAGLTAMVLLTVNVVMGILISRNYNPAKRWPRRRIPLFRIHNWTAYTALAVVLLHPTLLLFAERPHFRVFDILLPVSSPGQTFYNSLGAMAFWCVLVVVITSYFRPRMGSRPWKKIHYTAYFAAAFLVAHGLLIDPDLKNRRPDLMDGEKVLVECCLLAVCVAGLWRLRQKRKMI
jgi:DMSO/TMAO reductase YedYZ heme-binding membrane subunit